MPNTSSVALILLLLACSNAVQADPRAPPELVTDTADCDQLAALPDAPMTVEACRTMLGMGRDDPNSHRPGDDAMSCEQIFGELRTMQGEGVSDVNIARTDALIGEGRALGAQHAAEMARQMTPSPLAIASAFLPNAVGAALMAPEQARQVAAMAKLKTEDQRYSGQLSQQMTAESADIDRLMQDNPRLPRLMQLAMMKDCEPPQG